MQPEASTVFATVTDEVSPVRIFSRSSFMATSPLKPTFPVPSMMVPPFIRISNILPSLLLSGYHGPTIFGPTTAVGSQQERAGIYVVRNRTGKPTASRYITIGFTS